MRQLSSRPTGRRRLGGFLVGALWCAGMLAALAHAAPAAPASSAASNAPATTPAPVKLRIGVLKLASSGAVFIAQARGYFRAQGLDVELRYFDAAEPIAVAAASGDVDVGVTAFTTGLFNLAAKDAVKVIAGQSRAAPGYPLIAYLAATRAPGADTMHKPQDLAGKSVAVTQLGSTFHYSLGLLAEKYHFPLASIRIVPLQSLSNVAAAVAGGTVQGALLPVTIAQPLIASGAARLLGWVGNETPWQLGAAFVSESMEARPDLINKFLIAYRQGLSDYYHVLLKAEKNGAVPVTPATGPLLDIIAHDTGQPVARIRTGLPDVDPQGRLDLADVAHQIAWNQKHDYLPKGFGVDAIIDKRFVTP